MSRFLPATVAFLAIAATGALAFAVAVAPNTVPGAPAGEFLGPRAQMSEPVVVVIEEGDGAREMAEALEKEGVISSARLFRVLVAFMDIEDELQAGEYEFDTNMPVLVVIDRIHQGVTAPNVVTVPEGLRLEEVAALLEEKGVVSAADFLAAADDAYAFAFLSGRPEGATLEGYLFPATYGFSRNPTAEKVIGQMLEAFQKQVVPEIVAEIAASELDLHEVITLASIVEREARKPEERPLIASVYLNRLKVGLALQADPTVQYALASDKENVQRYGFWKKELSFADLEVESPYNTYKYVGLPPGPIASPGLDSIRAVVRPARTNYLFFVARDDGSHVFAETLDEHLRNVEEYVR
ncbi:MAG: endolytic transglycosylase MltG [Dehalococcoidia bacterium]|nr:endolytic transglycosylase MltG [Dehalococcoidia bacterium]